MTLEESYQTLGLKPGATLHEARRAYHKLIKFFHPDRHFASPNWLRQATEETKKINLAYECVCKVLGAGRPPAPEKRKSDKPPRAETSGYPPMPGKPFVVPGCGVKLSWVAPGRFRMGSPAGEAGRSQDEGPLTEVTISRGFWLGIFPVTQEEWKTVAEGEGLKVAPSFFRGNRLPVEQVSWNDCQKWLQALNKLEKLRLPPNFQYRLPTEAEWEFSCRAGTATPFCSGDAEATLDEYAWHTGNSRGQTHPAGEKKANAWRFHDMHGNVWEWCDDWYGGLPGGKVTVPRGPVSGFTNVIRGGSWGMPPVQCRSAYRVWNKPVYRDYTIGFRLALGSTE